VSFGGRALSRTLGTDYANSAVMSFATRSHLPVGFVGRALARKRVRQGGAVAQAGPGPAILVEGLTKSFGEVRALRGIDLAVPSGTVLGVLGPNGAGKTTAVRILTTLLLPDSGRAVVEGRDVVREPAAVRRMIGLSGQSAAIQEELTGKENLELIGRLYHLSWPTARSRATELLEGFDLVEAADRQAKTYSGGMQRRLDLAASLVGRPKVLFLDEPTTGLDPRSRLGMWDVIRALAAGGTTVLLTTQYLDEADELADTIVVFDHGQVIAEGTAEQLKGQIGGDVLEFAVPDRGRLGDAVAAVKPLGEGEPHIDADTGSVSVGVGGRGSDALIEAVRSLDAAGVVTHGLALRRPSLDDVFLALTGHATEEDGQPGGRRRGRRTPAPAADAKRRTS
jgi:ABC-2 type transport system ATP-binding protein